MTPDSQASHRFHAAEFFNRTWDLLEKPTRTPDENEHMVSMCYASLSHWRLREDCTPLNLSVGCWQLARVYAVLDQADNAMHYGRLCLGVSEQLAPFFIAYAHEAIARAAKLKGDQSLLDFHLAAALEFAAQVTDAEPNKGALQDDLRALNQACTPGA